jgi:hypothetical protein
MNLENTGEWHLGADVTANILAELARVYGAPVADGVKDITIDPAALGFSQHSKFIYCVVGGLLKLRYVAAPTEAEIDACLVVNGLDPTTQSQEVRDATRDIIILVRTKR